MRIPSDIIIQPDSSGNWIIYNVFTQNTLAVDNNTIALLGLIAKGEAMPEIKNKYSQMAFQARDIEIFSNYCGLLADPTRRIRNSKDWPEPKIMDVLAVIDLLEKKNFIVSDENKYKELFQPKKSLLDNSHLGNMHQQLGQFLLLNKHENPGDWWVKQKFNEDCSELKNTLYNAVQGNFLESFFKERFNSSHFIIDIGCGAGYYTKLMGRTGARVLGIDPNPKYISTAQRNSSKNVLFKVSEIGNPGNLSWIESSSADIIFMSDALLFYFISPDPNKKQDINILFSEIKRILKPNGRFFSVEPSGVFWLRPWLGEEEKPFTILTEHRNKRFNVAPNHAELINAFIRGRFIIDDFKEIGVNEKFSEIDRRAAYFAKEFPLWYFFELEPRK